MSETKPGLTEFDHKVIALSEELGMRSEDTYKMVEVRLKALGEDGYREKIGDKRLIEVLADVEKGLKTDRQTHVIEFSVHLSRDALDRLFAYNGLVRDKSFSSSNGGVTFGWRITGPLKVLQRLAKKFGYPGQNPDLVQADALDRLLGG